MPRLYHTKSKTGCKRCRARRVKCDEAWPTCGGCRRHQVDCHYDRLDAAGNATHTPAHTQGSVGSPSSVSSSSKENTRNPSLTESRDRRHRELQLLHVFTVRSSHTMPGAHMPQLLETWAVDVPSMALDYEPLLSAIMAFSSHQLAREASTQEKAEEYMTLRSLYLETTLSKHRVAVGELNQHNADAVSFTTVLLTVDSFAQLRERPLDPYEPPTQWLHLSRGIGGVYKLALDILKDDRQAKIWPIVTTMIPFVREARSTSAEPLAHLLQAQEGEELDQLDLLAYEEMTRFLCWMIKGYNQGEEAQMYCRRITAFPVLIPDHYMALLERQEPRALVLLAHFFALTTCGSGAWWIDEMPFREFGAIQAHLGARWQGMLRWPMQLVQERMACRAERAGQQQG